MGLPLEKKTGTNFGPPGNSKLVYFLDDLNLSEVGACQINKEFTACKSASPVVKSRLVEANSNMLFALLRRSIEAFSPC